MNNIGVQHPALTARAFGNSAAPVLLLALTASLALLSFAKGWTSRISDWGQFHWLVNYDQGFIKRGLIGHLFGSLVRDGPLEQRLALVNTINMTAAVLLILGLHLWAYRLMTRPAARPDRYTLPTVLLLFATAQFLPSVAHTAGYLDIFLYVLFAVSAAFVARGHVLAAGLIGCFGPFIHESFVFLWVSCVILMWWTPETSAWPWQAGASGWLTRLIGAALPIVATAFVLLFHRQDAATAQILTSSLPEDVKRGVIVDQFGQTAGSAFRVMLGIYRTNFGNFILAAVFLLTPVAVMVLAYAAARFRRHFWFDTAALALATLAPTAMLLFGWDLSRFLVATALSGLVAILVCESRLPTAPQTHFSAWHGLAWSLALAGFLVPLISGNFWQAGVVSNPLPFKSTNIEQGIRTLVDTRYNR